MVRVVCSSRPMRGAALQTRALFGGGRDREAEREEMWRKQQEIIAERRSGSGKFIKEAMERRRRVREQVAEKKAMKQRWREALARGEKFEEEVKELYSEEDNDMSGIVIPLAPFGIPKYDNGERFDLRLPYAEEGWVDPDADPFKWLKNIFGKKKKEDEESSEEKDA